ncbi:MAG: hypothetical protein PHX34_04035 [Candidatus Shapirobacteria bacterium]|nr:hypothetical protein [Candidatus Shapirobacteria bacterium]
MNEQIEFDINTLDPLKSIKPTDKTKFSSQEDNKHRIDPELAKERRKGIRKFSQEYQKTHPKKDSHEMPW